MRVVNSYRQGMALALLTSIPVAVLTEFVSSFAGTAVVVTGMFAGSARAWVVLRESPHKEIEWMTAAGFVFGLVFTIAIVCIDSVGSS